MAKTFHLTVAKVGETIFDGEVLSVLLPGADGVFQVLSLHEAFVTELKNGTVKIETAPGEKHQLQIQNGGIAEISGNQATILL